MSGAGKKFVLDLPLKIVLTEQGASHFISHKQKLLRFKLADNQEEFGISMEHFTPASLQEMILVGYISKIEISMPEFVSHRQEIMDLSKVIVYSILYKQFEKQIFNSLIQCDCVRKYNRSNPSQLIDERTRIPERQLRSYINGKNDQVQKARKTILEPVWQNIMDDSSLTPEERNVFLLMTEKFLNRLSLMNWYIIVKFMKNPGFDEILSVVRRNLSEYMEKSKIAEYSSVMLMELALNCENTNLRKQAKVLYDDETDIDALIYDPDIRNKIIEELKRKHEYVFISWKIAGGSASIGKQGRLQITLYNQGEEFQEIKENIESKMSADTDKQNLIDFYKALPEGEAGNGLGLYYLSYLDEACKKVNVKFDSLVNQYANSDLTVINLIFNF